MEPFVETFAPLVVAVLTTEQYVLVRKDKDAAVLLDALRGRFEGQIFWLCHFDSGIYVGPSELYWHVGKREPLAPELQAVRGDIGWFIRGWFEARLG